MILLYFVITLSYDNEIFICIVSCKLINNISNIKYEYNILSIFYVII